MTGQLKHLITEMVLVVLAVAIACLAGCGHKVTVKPPTYTPQTITVTPTATTQASQTVKDAGELGRQLNVVRSEVASVTPANLDIKLPAIIGMIDLVDITAQKVYESAVATQKAVEVKENELKVVRDVLTKTQAQAKEAVEKFDTLNSQWQAKYSDLESKWYVRYGKWVERIFWALVIAWAVAGTLAIVSGVNLLPGLAWLSKEIVRAIPLMNPFAWVRDFINSRKASGAAQVATPPAPTPVSNINIGGGVG